MNGDQFEFRFLRREALVVVEGPGAPAVARSLFGSLPAAGRLDYLTWEEGRGPAATAWFPPARLELRVAAEDLSGLLGRLARLGGQAPPLSFAERLAQLVSRLEAWSYSDSDSGSGPAESMAGELSTLGQLAPSPAVRRAVLEARDALDDGLPPEVIAATLERATGMLRAGQASGLDPSASG